MNVLETIDYHTEEYPEYAKKCHKCGSINIKRKVEGYIDYKECEVSYQCSKCEEYVAYWAYGYYDPIYDPNYVKEMEERKRLQEELL